MINSINSSYASQLQAVNQNSNDKQKTEETVETKKLTKVEEIKQQIQAGTYKVDMQKTAEAMANTLI
jgi:anti-sigma28 factor (negative regulator of flagellin synthesis)